MHGTEGPSQFRKFLQEKKIFLDEFQGLIESRGPSAQRANSSGHKKRGWTPKGANHRVTRSTISTQAIPLHIKPLAYGCSFPRLTGFTSVQLSGARISTTVEPGQPVYG